MGDPFLNGPAFIEAEAKRKSEETKSRVNKMTRNQLMNRGDVLRVINQDDVIKMIRAYIQSQHDDCMTRLFDPQLSDINTVTMLKGEIQAHKKYLDLFTAWEKEGRAALKKLHEEKNGQEE